VKEAQDFIDSCQDKLNSAKSLYTAGVDKCKLIPFTCSLVEGLKKGIDLAQTALTEAQQALNAVKKGPLATAIIDAKNKLSEAQRKANQVAVSVQARAKSAAESALAKARIAKDGVVKQAQSKIKSVQGTVDKVQKAANNMASSVQAKAMAKAKEIYDKANSTLTAAQATVNAAEAKLTGALDGIDNAIELIKANNYLAITELSLHVVAKRGGNSLMEVTVNLTVGQFKVVITVSVNPSNPSAALGDAVRKEAIGQLKSALPDVSSFLS
jgi:DNA repair exonuclease SbcCD ATPase subunit